MFHRPFSRFPHHAGKDKETQRLLYTICLTGLARVFCVFEMFLKNSSFERTPANNMLCQEAHEGK